MPKHLRSAWNRTLFLLAALLVIAGVIGGVIGVFWEAIAMTSLGIVIWQFWRLRNVLRRLTARARVQAGTGDGVWNELDRLLHRSQTDMRTRKRRLLAMLRAYRAAAAALPDAVVIIDRNTQRVQWFNEAATSLLGLNHPTDLGASIGDRLQPLPMSHWLSTGRNAEPMLDTTSPVNPAIRLSLRLIPYSDQHWLLVARDVSKLLRLEEMRRDFVANVSHELRTPLTVVHGYLDMLDSEEYPAWKPVVEEMQKQSSRMTQLVEDLLTLSRLEVQDSLPDERIVMASMLTTLRREAEALSQGRHTIVVEDCGDIDLTGSNKELHSAFSNLVSNAVRYTPIGGTITITFAYEDKRAVLRVCDTGYGIPSTHLPRITERFYRVSTSRSRDSGGTGLGLSIVKHVLNLHQARLDIHSEVGQGSTFSVHFGHERVYPRETTLPLSKSQIV